MKALTVGTTPASFTAAPGVPGRRTTYGGTPFSRKAPSRSPTIAPRSTLAAVPSPRLRLGRDWQSVGVVLPLGGDVLPQHGQVAPADGVRVTSPAPSQPCLPHRSEAVHSARGLRLRFADKVAEPRGWRVTHHHVDVICEDRDFMHPYPRAFAGRSERGHNVGYIALPDTVLTPPGVPTQVRITPWPDAARLP